MAFLCHEKTLREADCEDEGQQMGAVSEIELLYLC
jgi:hypothetical protein